MKIRFISLSALCCAALVFLSGCGKKDDGKIRIGVSIPSADHGWTGGVVYWAEQTKKDLERKDPKLEIILSTAKDSSEQVNKIENLMVQGIKEKFSGLTVVADKGSGRAAPGTRAADRYLFPGQRSRRLSGRGRPRT